MSAAELVKNIMELPSKTPLPEAPDGVLFTGFTKDGKSTVMTYLESPEVLKAVEDVNDVQAGKTGLWIKGSRE